MRLKEIGKKFGLNRERIRQLRRDALIKFRFS
jgi:DNA-directed RNA polymerase sigma subunit (sigma70/sigma32)